MDGVATPEEYADRAASLGMPALAITDHGVLSGHRPMYRAAKEKGIKPILGVEGYFTADRFDKRDKTERTTPLDLIYNHIVILAKDARGLQNLNTLNEIGWTEGFYKKPRIDFEVLDKYGDGLVISSACMSGLINKAIEVDDYAVAKQHIKWFMDRFGDDFYVELMPHNVAGMNTELYNLANEMGAKCIVTPDCHHCTKDQKVIQEMMLALNTHAKIQKDASYEKSAKIPDMMQRLDYLYGEDRPMSFRSFDIHLLSYDEMKEGMEKEQKFDDSIYAHTLEIAEKVEDYKLRSNLNLLPIKVKNPENELRNVAHSYSPDVENPEYALKKCNLSWKDGGRYAVLGPSGCGKTTMLNIMSGLVTPSEGTIKFDGVDITNMSTAERNIAQATKAMATVAPPATASPKTGLLSDTPKTE